MYVIVLKFIIKSRLLYACMNRIAVLEIRIEFKRLLAMLNTVY